MAKVIVRGGAPGKIRLEVEGSEEGGVDIDNSLTAYDAMHAAAPFMQALADSVPAPVKRTLPPKKGDE